MIRTTPLALLAFLALLLPGAPAPAGADEASHRAAAARLLVLSGTDRMLEPMLRETQEAQKAQIEALGIPEEARPVVEKYLGRLNELMVREFGWDRIEKEFVELYTGVFTEPEILELIRFYESPAGRKLVEKTPDLLMAIGRFTRKKSEEMAPEMRRLAGEMEEEIRRELVGGLSGEGGEPPAEGSGGNP